jgi:hypothetical protein
VSSFGEPESKEDRTKSANERFKHIKQKIQPCQSSTRAGLNTSKSKGVKEGFEHWKQKSTPADLPKRYPAM